MRVSEGEHGGRKGETMEKHFSKMDGEFPSRENHWVISTVARNRPTSDLHISERWGQQREGEKTVTYKGLGIRMISSFSTAMLGAGGQWRNAFRIWRKFIPTGNSIHSQLSIKYESGIKIVLVNNV